MFFWIRSAGFKMFWPVWDWAGIKYWSSPDLNSMRWLGLFTNKTFRKNLKLIFPHRDFIMCIVSLAIFHPHFSIRILSSAFFHPHFSIRILSSAFFYPLSAIRHPPPSGPHFTETLLFAGLGRYGEKLWPRPQAEGSIFKNSVIVFHHTDLPAGK